jgi:hypothetical protein
LGAWWSSARATHGVMPAACDAVGAGAGLAEAGLAWVRADERTAGFRAAGRAVVPRGASTVTAGSGVWASAVEGMRETALPSTSRLTPPKA